MPELSKATESLISKYAPWQQSLKPLENISTIHVDEVASKVAAFYESVRTIVDWKEEHLMRRAAISRKLTRKFSDLEDSASTDKIAESLVIDLIRGGFFPNDKIEETNIEDVQKIIEKYLFIIQHRPPQENKEIKENFYNRLLEIASCEIEETLAPSIKEMALIEYMFEVIKDRIVASESVYQRNLLTPEDKDIQTYVAVQQALFKLDEPIISYNLIRYKYPQWDNPAEEELLKIAQNIYKILTTIEADLVHPLAKKFYNICEKYDTAYLLVGDIVFNDSFEKTSKEISDAPLLENHIRNAYAKRLEDLKAKINRAAMYSVASIFITKIISLLMLEYLLSLIFRNELNMFYLFIDVIVPTALMTVLVMTIKPPSKKNINLVIIEIMKIFYFKEKTDTYVIKVSKKKGWLTKTFLSLTYVIGASISLSFIYLAFHYFAFPLYSIVINVIFIALILFAGTAVQKKARELSIEEETGGFLMFFLDILILPITGVGRWMSNKWKRHNVFAAILNALIDMPFGMFVEFLERWRGFIKEKKEEM